MEVVDIMEKPHFIGVFTAHNIVHKSGIVDAPRWLLPSGACPQVSAVRKSPSTS